MMAQLQAGVVTINDVLYSFGEPESTWSGYRKSGIGHTHGAAGLREMCRQRFVSFDPRLSAGPVFGYPYDGPGKALVETAMRSMHDRRLSRRLGALARLAFSRRFRSRVPTRSFLAAWKRRAR